MANVTLTLEEHSDLMGRMKAAEEEAGKLRNELLEAKSSHPDVAVTLAAFRNALAIARFAVANLPPEIIKGWPTEELRGLMDRLPLQPDYGPDDISLISELRSFVRECEYHDLRRKGLTA